MSDFATIPGGGNGHVVFVRGSLYVTAFQSHRIYRVSMDGEVTHLARTGNLGEKDGAALEAQFSWHNGIATNSSGDRLFVNDFLNRRPPTMEMPPKPLFSVRQIMLESLADVAKAALESGGVDAPAKLAQLSRVEVMPLEMVYMGDFFVEDRRVKVRDLAEFESHYYNLIMSEEAKQQGKKVRRVLLNEVYQQPETERFFWNKAARKVFKKHPVWGEWVRRSRATLDSESDTVESVDPFLLRYDR